jgi:flagellar hook-associated protein 1
MLGLFGTLNLAGGSLQVQQQGIEVAGHNLANVNNSAYARQRVAITTALTIPTPIGPVGTGAQIVRIQQLRSSILDSQIVSETGVTGYYEAQQSSMQLGEAILGQSLDRTASTTSTEGQGISESLAEMFNAFQSLSTNPTSITERQAVLLKAQNLASQFRQIDSRLGDLRTSLDQTLSSDVEKANSLMSSIANENTQIVAMESSIPGCANDLRDLRQQHIEELSKLVNIQTTEQPSGAVDISISGTTLVSGINVTDQLETYDAGGGQMLVRTQTGQTPLTLTSGSTAGVIDARDGALQTLRDTMNTLASQLITQVNLVHRTGYSLNGTTGADFFTGTNAADIDVNSALLNDPSELQASGENGSAGDNQVALALAQLAAQKQPGLKNQTFSQDFDDIVGSLGNAIKAVNGSLEDQNVVNEMLTRQRDAVSGVSLDDEMTDMIKFQKAYQASAKLVSVVDELLQTVLNMV